MKQQRIGEQPDRRRKPDELGMALRQSEARLSLGYELLRELAWERTLDDERLANLLRRITETGSRILEVARIGIWLRNAQRDTMRCADLYEMPANRHLVEPPLRRSAFPRYFAALDSDRLVAAEDALNDPITSELAEPYLRPRDIRSLLDAPIHVDRETVGVVCHEHVGSVRHWTTAERDGATAVADLVALGVRSRQQRDDEERLRERATLLDAATDAVLVVSLADRIQSWNAGAERIYGWTSAEVSGRPAAEVLQPRMTGLRDSLVARVASEGAWSGELQELRRDGRPVTVASRWTLVRGPDGAPHSILVINSDITEERVTEARLRRAQRMESIGMITGGMAHDLNNVLTPVMATAGLLRETETAPDRRELLDTIEEGARRGAQLIRQVLQFARGHEGPRDLLPTAGLVRQLEATLRRVLPASVRLEVQIAPDVWGIVGDPTQIHQILMNLGINACDAMEDGGSLTITVKNQYLDEAAAADTTARQPGPYVAISVRDTGVGMSTELLEHIFDPFFSTKTLGRGFGLGLSVTLGIVRSHGGFMTVKSEAGHGTEFCVYLPAEPAEAGAPAEPPSAPAPRGHGELVLVVEDDPKVAETVKRILESHDYRVIVATDGSDAVSTYVQQRGDVALVLTDMTMPVMGGEATILALRRIDAEVRIVAMSGLEGALKTAGKLDPPVTGLLSKPFTAAELLIAMNTGLTNSAPAPAPATQNP